MGSRSERWRTSSCSRWRPLPVRAARRRPDLRHGRHHRLMRPPRYHRPASSADALAALGATGSVAFGGGTDLLVTMREGLAEPAPLVVLRPLRGARHLPARPAASMRIA